MTANGSEEVSPLRASNRSASRTGCREAEGQKKDAVLEAEGTKQSAILQAQGEAAANMKVADANKYGKLTMARGEGQAIETVFGAIHQGGRPSISLLLNILRR